MQYDIYATLPHGGMVFSGQLNYVPHKGEEIEANGHVFIVNSVRYILRDGISYNNQVRLILTQLS